MQTDEWETLLTRVSPDYYKQFKHMYHELLGYIERNDTAAIRAFANRLDTMMHQATAANMAFYNQCLAYVVQYQDGVRQQMLHQALRNPPMTIPITHPFPIVATRQNTKTVVTSPKAAPSVRVGAKTNQTSQPNKAAGVVIADAVAPAPRPDAEPLPVKAHQPTVQSVSPQPVAAAPPASGNVTKTLADEALYIQKKGPNRDVDRSKKTASSPRSAPQNQSPPTKGTSRRERIWDYIQKDQSKGGISHDT
jgi:hypothetical protein